MKKLGFFCLLTFLACLPAVVWAQSMADYTHFPIFMAETVTPNILILFDTSGSMNAMAYGYEADGYYHADAFNPAKTYYGYFDSTSKYTYSSNVFRRDAGGAWDGNFLNWLTMRRIDVARKVLAGGLATSRTGGGNTHLIGETPAQDERRYFKLYENSSLYTPYGNDHVYKISRGKVEVYQIADPAQLPYTFDYKLHCNAYNGHDQFFEDILLWYDGLSNQNEKTYSVFPMTGAGGGCDYGLYGYAGASLTTLTHVETYDVEVDKDEVEEPDEFLDGNIAGVLQRLAPKARFGLEVFNRGDGVDAGNSSNYDGGKILSNVGGNITNLVTNVENMAADSWTPLAEALYEGVRYYRQEAPYYGNNYSVNQSNDPYYWQSEGVYAYCAKSFVLLITGGDSTYDLNVPVAYQDYDHDGNDPGAYPNSGSDFLDDVALWAHTNDMRDDLDGKQTIDLYTVFAFGTGSQLITDAAKNGGFTDMNGNGVPDLANEWDENGDGVPDNSFEARDGTELRTAILGALVAMLEKAASGTAVSVLATSSEGEGSLFQAFFKPVLYKGERRVRWLGYLNSLWVDPFGHLREDTDGNGALTYGEDKIIAFAYDPGSGDTLLQRYSDSDADGAPDSATPDVTVPLDQIQPIWEAGKKLALRNPSTRVIKTFVDADQDGVVDTGELIDFTEANATTLRPYLRAADSTEAGKIIRFIRGEEVTGYRDRTITVESQDRVWPLGDIVYSTPTVVGKPMDDYATIYGDAGYEDFFIKWRARAATVYCGANDGMLHAFKAGTFHPGDKGSSLTTEHGWYSAVEDPPTSGELGSERWAFIPYNLLPHLKWLTSADEPYTHTYYVDLKPRIADVRIFTDGAGQGIDANHPGGWGTILIGGMRLGGKDITTTDDFGSGVETRTFRSAYFAVDVTVPGAPRFLWEFTHPDLALTTSYPAIARVDGDRDTPADEKWFAILGSGPTDYDGTSDQTASVFVINLATGQVEQTFQGADANAFMASPITVDVHLNYSVDTAYIGQTYLDGATWKGRVFRLQTKDCVGDQCISSTEWTYQADPANWTFSTLFSTDRPITAPPSASLDNQRNFWVYFGTGKYFSYQDETDTSVQYFYGLKDDCYTGRCTDEILLGNLFDASSATIYVGGEVSGVAGITQWTPLVSHVRTKDGWYTSLSTNGERVLSKPSVLGGATLFTSFKPEGDICQFGGTAKLYAVYHETGTANKESVIGTEEVGDQQKVKKEMDLGFGLPSSIGIHVGKKKGGTGFVQQSTGVIEQIDITAPWDFKSGVVSWTFGEDNEVCK